MHQGFLKRFRKGIFKGSFKGLKRFCKGIFKDSFKGLGCLEGFMGFGVYPEAPKGVMGFLAGGSGFWGQGLGSHYEGPGASGYGLLPGLEVGFERVP